ncbi:hypothetical protein BRD00_12545 [Halobacteriales archaeon QS_8_69_26]|nr:MAG: hypothetical protein BRD00_12545 [Halobacteriales archaeon QS_8_69_26]
MFGEGGRITVKSEGSFATEGTDEDPVVIEGESATPGYWQGIRFRSNNRNNSIDEAEIANGGSNGYANVYLDDSSRASVTNCTLRSSSTFGIIAESGTTLEASGNTFEDNADGDIQDQNE